MNPYRLQASPNSSVLKDTIAKSERSSHQQMYQLSLLVLAPLRIRFRLVLFRIYCLSTFFQEDALLPLSKELKTHNSRTKWPEH